jgi:hypothetical protein
VRQTNPYLVLTTAFYLACKTEECPQHIRFVVGEARGLWPGRNLLQTGLGVGLTKPQNSSPRMWPSWASASSR